MPVEPWNTTSFFRLKHLPNWKKKKGIQNEIGERKKRKEMEMKKNWFYMSCIIYMLKSKKLKLSIKKYLLWIEIADCLFAKI